MLTDSLVDIVEMLPNLEVGECVVIGNVIMLSFKIILDYPKKKPKSVTIDFCFKGIMGNGRLLSLIR